MTPKDNAYSQVEQLVLRFDEQYHSYKRNDYNETLARRDFIDPFFKALGWDVDNSQGHAEAYREVIHEDKIKIGGAVKAPDYSFRLPGGKKLFFVEAKRPSVLVKQEMLPAYQVRRYAWSAKMPVSILTDFEELAVYDCTKKPFPTDKASTARIKYLLFKEYLPQFDFLYDTFSKEKVLKGSFDKFITSDTHKKGTATVDHAFLASLDEWRKQLASNVALRNELLTEDELNFVVQQILDRIIFLRIAEDRSVEEYGKLHTIFKDKTKDPYQHLLAQFYEADSKYNSGLFDFRKDTISSKIDIDAKTLKSIIQELYYPNSPYAFDVISVEILGTAYEQFLGKQIKLTAGHRAVIEDKPEVRKAGGVYYTPQYIVDYIVQNTVDKLVTDKKPDEVTRLKIVDPACGSGSFLLGAYDFLLKWHREYYKPSFEKLSDIASSNEYTIKQRKDAIRDRNKLPLTPDGNLTTALKKKILINNIFGVDIDIQAVEVTKLSLLLKCLEGETGSSINAELLFGERVLPTLDNNIKSGNSLIDVNFYDGQIEHEPDTEKTIKPFSWQQAFPAVFKQKGFDVVIGNPPYRLMQPKDTSEAILTYFKKNYSLSGFKIDLFHLFYQHGVRILKNNGVLGFITPSSILNNVFVENLREWLLEQCKLRTIALTKEKVFADADVYTAVFILERNSNERLRNENLVQTTIELEKIRFEDSLNYSFVRQERFKSFEGKVWNILISEANAQIIEKIQLECALLKDLAILNRGLITGDRSKYFSTKQLTLKHVPILAGADVFRYGTKPVSEYVLFERPKTSGGCWDEDVHFAKHKILIRQIGFSPTASLITEPIAVTGNIFTIRTPSLSFEKYILGILNSKLIEYYWKIMFSDFKNSFPQVTIFSLSLVPIKKNPNGGLKTEIISLVDTMLQLNEKLHTATLQHQKDQLKQRITFTDKKIDKLVYELYGLNEEEVRIVEGENIETEQN